MKNYEVLYSLCKPSYSTVMRDFIMYFHENFMMPYENRLSEKQLQIFEVKWANCREKLGADIEGSMTKSILECHKIIGCDCCK